MALDRSMVFREVNERIADIGFDALDRHTELREFLCECGRAGCRALIPLTYAAYQEAHRSPHFFLVAPGHDDPARDRVAERSKGYWIVEERRGAAQGS
jgi:hypothetical protein